MMEEEETTVDGDSQLLFLVPTPSVELNQETPASMASGVTLLTKVFSTMTTTNLSF